MTAIDDC